MTQVVVYQWYIEREDTRLYAFVNRLIGTSSSHQYLMNRSLLYAVVGSRELKRSASTTNSTRAVVVQYWAQAGLPLRWRLYQWAKCDQAQAYTIHAHSPSLHFPSIPFYTNSSLCISHISLLSLIIFANFSQIFVNVRLITAASY